MVCFGMMLDIEPFLRSVSGFSMDELSSSYTLLLADENPKSIKLGAIT